MRVLSIDTSTVIISLAVLEDDLLLAELNVNIGQTHSVSVMPLVETLLAQSKVTLGQIDAFAYGLGPGSFTGLRIGMALMKGFALSMDKPAYGVGSLNALSDASIATQGLIAAVLDARRNEVFLQCFVREGLSVREVLGPIHASPEKAGQMLAELSDAAPICVISDVDAGIRQRIEAGANKPILRFAPRMAGIPMARWIAQAVIEGRATLDDGTLEPCYVRPIDAKLPSARKPVSTL